MTCMACPSQWDIYTEDGQYIYARYRFGRLSVVLNAFTDNEEVLLEKEIGDKYDGDMTTGELKMHTSNILEWP